MKSLTEEPDADEPGYYCAWIVAPEIDAQRISLSIADCLQCFRTALDQLAFEFASAFTVPMTDEVEKDSAFPVLSDVDKNGTLGVGPHKWATAVRTTLRGVDPAVQAAIEGLQPYKRGHAYDTDPLWRLSLLNNAEKHRVLHVAQRVLNGASMPVAGSALPRSQWPRNVAAIGRPDGQPFVLEIAGEIAAEGRTRVARWPMIPIDPSKKMYMGFRPIIDIAFGSRTRLVADTPVLDALGEISDHISDAVLPALKPFL